MIIHGAKETKYFDTDRPEKVLDFIEKITALCKEYGFVIGHEDIGGAFEIHDENNRDEIDAEWLEEAVYIKDIAD